MKILILNILLLTAGAVLANEADSNESSGESALDNHNSDDGLSSFFSQQSTHSVINSNGNSVVVSRRFNSKGKEETYISIASPKIRIDGEYFTCASLTCPSDAFNCHVNSEAIADDRNNMKTIAECQDKDGKVLESKEIIEENPYPKDDPPYNRVANVNRDGSIDVKDSNGAQSFTSIRRKLTKEEQEKLEKDIAEQTRRAQEHFKQQVDELNNHFNRIFGPGSGFPFGNNGGNVFGPSFPFGNNFPFGNSYPFRNSFDSFGSDAVFSFNNWPFVSSFGFYPFSYPSLPPPQIPNRYPYNPQMPETFDTNRPRPHRPTTNAQRPSQNEIETNTELDAENDLIEATTYRSSDNNVVNYLDKYRYAHTN